MAIDAACCRCRDWFVLEPKGAGFAREYVGLCPKCSGEVGDLDNKLAGLKRRLRSLNEDAQGWRRTLNGASSGGDAARDRIWGFRGSAFNFFHAVGKVALAAEGLSIPDGQGMAVSGGGRSSAKDPLDLGSFKKALSKGVWPPKGLSKRPWTTPRGGVGAVASEKANPNKRGKITSLHSHITAYNGEWDSFHDAVYNRREIPILSPAPPGHRSNKGGFDHVTGMRRGRNRKQLTLYFYDASTSTIGNFKKPVSTVPARWKNRLKAAVNKWRAKNRQALKKQVLEALKHDRVVSRQVNVDYRPQPRPTGWPKMTVLSRGRPIRPRGPASFSTARFGSAVDKFGKVFDIAEALMDFARAAETLSDDMGEYFVSRREAADWQKLLDDIDRRIEEASKEIACLQGEKTNRETKAAHV